MTTFSLKRLTTMSNFVLQEVKKLFINIERQLEEFEIALTNGTYGNDSDSVIPYVVNLRKQTSSLLSKLEENRRVIEERFYDDLENE